MILTTYTIYPYKSYIGHSYNTCSKYLSKHFITSTHYKSHNKRITLKIFKYLSVVKRKDTFFDEKKTPHNYKSQKYISLSFRSPIYSSSQHFFFPNYLFLSLLQHDCSRTRCLPYPSAKWRVRTGFHTRIRVASYRPGYDGHSAVSG